MLGGHPRLACLSYAGLCWGALALEAGRLGSQLLPSALESCGLSKPPNLSGLDFLI